MYCLPFHQGLHLTHSYLETFNRVIGNSADPNQMPHNVASDQGLHCLLTGFSIKDKIKVTKMTSYMTNGLVQHIIVEESTNMQWVKEKFFSHSLTREQIFSFKVIPNSQAVQVDSTDC